MKNVFLILFLLVGFSKADLQAQQCTPGPTCQPGCCKGASRNASSTAQIMPVTLDILAAYPMSKPLVQIDPKCTTAEVAACKTACTSGKTACTTSSAPLCQSAASVAFQPSNAPQCQPAASKTVQTTNVSFTPQSNQAPKPMKG